MFTLITRLALLALAALAGALWPLQDLGPELSAAVAGAVAAVFILSLTLLERGTPGMMFGAIAGFVIAAWLSYVINGLIFSGFPSAAAAEDWKLLRYAVIISLCGMGLALGLRAGRWINRANVIALFTGDVGRRRYKILDTSVIIDGRVADICETGFLDGVLLVPQFVLRELQQIADSSQPIKRNRGRRGLEILQKIKKKQNIQVIVMEKDFPDIPEVDLKLIEVARTMGGKIVTNDFNLNKVAQLRGVEVLNINELANALKPVVLPGEEMRVFILKEGKEPNQGIGYLDDGTMIVVDNARHLIGQTVDLVVTSVLQTTAGKMIFGRLKDDDQADAYYRGPYENNSRKRGRRY